MFVCVYCVCMCVHLHGICNVYTVISTVEEWPDHVTFDQEPNWIVVDDTTLKRPPKKKLNDAKSSLLLTQSCPSDAMKVCHYNIW